MKKLMFVAVAMAAGMCLSDIVSNNIVGFQTRDVEGGYTLSTPVFIPVGGGDYDLANFKLGPDAAGDGTEVIQVLDTEGLVPATYVWLNENMGMDPGWYDNDTWAPVTAKIPAGNGFLMSANAAMAITTSGEVAGQDTVVTFPAGYSVLGNCSPVDLDIQKMTLPATAAGDGTEVIQVLDTEGLVPATYVWLNENMGQDPGWYDNDTWAPITATVKAGEAFLFSANADTTLTIPSAIK